MKLKQNPPPGQPPQPLPLIRTFQEAQKLAEEEGERFYLAAFAFQRWLNDLLLQTAAEYAEKKNARDRSLQRGQAWRAFLAAFPKAEKQGFCWLTQCLTEFCRRDDCLGDLLRDAWLCLTIEHECTGEFLGPKTIATLQTTAATAAERIADARKSYPEVNALARRTLVRWCDWLDALVHLHIHYRWHKMPACFEPDPEKRELAWLGTAQRQLGEFSDRAKQYWLSDFSAAVEHFKNSPKWPAVGKAMSDDSDRAWPYAEVDSHIIPLWPLVTRYNWTYRDLLNVLRSLNSQPPSTNPFHRYPCDTEQDLSAYCITALSLRKAGKGVSAKSSDGLPAGHEIAKQIFPETQERKGNGEAKPPEH